MDIVERLRQYQYDCYACYPTDEAADEIERLRAALQELLSGHDNLYLAHFGHLSNPRDDIAAKAARAALSPEQPQDGSKEPA